MRRSKGLSKVELWRVKGKRFNDAPAWYSKWHESREAVVRVGDRWFSDSDNGVYQIVLQRIVADVENIEAWGLDDGTDPNIV